VRVVTLLCALAVLTACSVTQRLLQPKASYIDLRFGVGGHAQQYSHTVDVAGGLWYLDGGEVIHQSSPARRYTVPLGAARSGAIFSYQGGVYVLNGNGTSLTRVDQKDVTVDVPARYTPVEGAVADSRHRWVIFARSARDLALVDVWRWYGERVPDGISPFASTLAAGPHGKKYLLVGDQRLPEIAIENRWTKRAVLMNVPENLCFSRNGSSWMVPVDVRGRDSYRAWISAGEHVASIDLASKRIMRVWDLDGCAMHILAADQKRAIVMVVEQSGARFASSLEQVDQEGVHPLRQYGKVDGIAAGPLLDGYDRFWWFDAKSKAFICRTPLS
jgi:hypothetical protein